MATIKDVAARAGVGLGTASRVLSGSSQTSDDSRARVLAAAAELDYVAHGPARSLRRARTDVLGLVVSDIRNPFFSELSHAAEQEARRLGYSVLLANANEDAAQADAYLRVFAAQRIDGLLLAPQGALSPQLTALCATGLPLVLVNRTVEGLDAPMIGSDTVGGVRSVLAWLRARGHHDVAYVGGPTSVSTAAERLSAYLEGRASHGISLDDRLVDAGDYLEAGAAGAMRRILERGMRPTALVGVNGPTTLGALRVLREVLGESAAQVETVSLDDLDWFDLAGPPISAVRNDAAAVGRLGVAALVERMRGGEVASMRVPTTFIDRSRDERTIA